MSSSLVLLASLCTADAHASPWVLEKGVVGVGVHAGASFATSEFLPDGRAQSFPLNGKFDGYFLQVDARFGVGNGLELSFKGLLKGISYQADSVLLVNNAMPPGSPQGYRDALLEFSRRALGLSDVYLGLSHQHAKAPFRLASRLELKLPTGYVAPRETFKGGAPGPGLVADDVTLGDGQLDLDYKLQFGFVIPRSSTLFQLDVGYRARFNGPGHQFLGAFKLGQAVGKHLFFFLETDAAINLFEGEPIGVTYVAKDPSVPAAQFTADNIETQPLRLDRSYFAIGAGAIVRIDRREWVLRVSQVLWGRNYSKLTTVSLGVLLSFG